ncbi:MAG: hypothetical protein P1Q69_11095 [Candidatus Thorarchaeota archaeon]|nr:hypothetical protein [Candidatus Thorarchaeota archaeon]
MNSFSSFDTLSEEHPVQFMLMSEEAGLNLISRVFEPYFRMDDNLVSGYLTAISTYSSEFLAKQLNQIRFGEYTLLM